MLTALAVLPIAGARLPPLYDYYHWLYQGHVFSRLLPWGGQGVEPIADLYSVTWAPVPNLGSLLGIGLLDLWFSTPTAGRLFLTICVLAFALGFASWVRSVQMRPTVLEFAGYLWAYGYFTYKGYLGYLLAVGIAFFALGRLHRSTRDRTPGPRDLAALTAMGLLAYLSHLFGWLVVLAALGVYAARYALTGQIRQAGRLALTVVPAALLLAWYVLGRPRGSITVYASAYDKLVSLFESLTIFMRTDPLPEPFPIFWANLVVYLLGATTVFFAVRPLSERVSASNRPVVFLGASLTVAAVVSPIHWLAGMTRPDERIFLVGLLILATALPLRRLGRRSGPAAAALVGLVLLLHTAEYRRGSDRLETILAQTRAVLGSEETVLTVTVWNRRFSAGGSGPTFGTPATKWFDTYRLIEDNQLTDVVMPTSLLSDSWPGGESKSHRSDTTVLQGGKARIGLRARAKRYDVTQVIGAPESLDAFAELLAHSHDLARRDSLVAVFRKKPKRGAPQVVFGPIEQRP